MQWIVDNWLVLLLVAGMAAMHLFGHGHAGHGGDRKKRNPIDGHLGHKHRTRNARGDLGDEKTPESMRLPHDGRT